MDEAAVKAQVLSHIRQASGRRKPILTAELTLGTSGTRADVAVLADAELIGLEIKTERDSLRRLPSQLEAYALYFDHVVVVAAPCHFAELAEMDLHGASVWRSTKDGLDPLISGQPNSVSPLAYLDLMTRQEKKEVVVKADATVREQYFDTFTRRYGETSRTLWQSVAGRKIKADDVRLLSRFIAALAATGIVTQAARSIGASLEALYKLRHRPGAEGFSAAWDLALDRGIARLEDCALERAILGEERPVVRGGEVVTTRRRYDTQLILFLLRQRRRHRFDAGIAADPRPGSAAWARLRAEWEAEGPSDAEVYAEIDEMIDRMRANMEANGRPVD